MMILLLKILFVVYLLLVLMSILALIRAHCENVHEHDEAGWVILLAAVPWALYLIPMAIVRMTIAAFTEGPSGVDRVVDELNDRYSSEEDE